jgi:hypothetical protein
VGGRACIANERDDRVGWLYDWDFCGSLVLCSVDSVFATGSAVAPAGVDVAAVTGNVEAWKSV